jgi:hypothetical protein
MGTDQPTGTWDDPSGSPGYITWIPLSNVNKGTNLGEWQDIVTPDPVLATGMASAVTENSSPGRAIGTSFVPSATRPVLCTYSGIWTGSLNVTGTQVGVLELRCDTSNPPTTKRTDVQPQTSLTLGISVGSTIGIPWSISYLCPIGRRVLLAASGQGSFTLTSQTETVM